MMGGYSYIKWLSTFPSNSTSVGTSSDWYSICKYLIERAEAGGFDSKPIFLYGPEWYRLVQQKSYPYSPVPAKIRVDVHNQSTGAITITLSTPLWHGTFSRTSRSATTYRIQSTGNGPANI